MKASQFIGEKKGDIIQFIKFSLIGVLNTGISLITYYVLIYIGIHYIIAYLVGFVLSIINAYYWNSKFVFKRKSKSYFVKMVISYGITTLLSIAFMFLLVEILRVSKYFAPLINVLITTPINFMLNKLWAFREGSSKEDKWK